MTIESGRDFERVYGAAGYELEGVYMITDSCEHLETIVEGIIGAANEVSNVLGAGVLEEIYERALCRELGMRGLRVLSRVPYPVTYKGQRVGECVTDLLVEDTVAVELKCVESLANEHLAECTNYLKASHLTLALLINFQKPEVEWKRVDSPYSCSSATNSHTMVS